MGQHLKHQKKLNGASKPLNPSRLEPVPLKNRRTTEIQGHIFRVVKSKPRYERADMFRQRAILPESPQSGVIFLRGCWSDIIGKM
jgi:hypothetical protein